MKRTTDFALAATGGLFLALLAISQMALSTGQARHLPVAAAQAQVQHVVLVDDYRPQPLMGETVWYYNRLRGDRGQVDGWWDPGCPCGKAGGGYVEWGTDTGTATITQTNGTEAWVGVWTSLNHVVDEEVPLDFAAIFPEAIMPA